MIRRTIERRVRGHRPAGRQVVMTFVIVAPFFAILSGCGHSGGDPGSRVFHSLQRVKGAVPPGVSIAESSSESSKWLPGCAYIPGSHAGWSEDLVSVQFIDSETPQVVVERIASYLQRLGWNRHDTSPSPGQGRLAHWTHRETNGPLANAFAFPVPAGSKRWIISASWQPPGPVDRGCP